MVGRFKADGVTGATRVDIITHTNWWSACDEVISPQKSAKFTPLSATNAQTVCLNHSQLHEDATVYGQVKAWVDPQVMAALAGPFSGS